MSAQEEIVNVAETVRNDAALIAHSDVYSSLMDMRYAMNKYEVKPAGSYELKLLTDEVFKMGQIVSHVDRSVIVCHGHGWPFVDQCASAEPPR